MSLSQNGIDYICQNFGDTNLCCVRTGLNWYYTAGGTNYNETGGTAQIVSRLASGLIDSLTMTNPARGTFTQAQLNTANGSAVSLPDAQAIAQRDQSPDQWCYTGGQTCSDYTTQATCEAASCYWYNNSCHSTPYVPTCPDYTNQTDCEAASCYWCTDHCQSQSCGTPPPPVPINWLLVGALVAAGLVGIVLLLVRKK